MSTVDWYDDNAAAFVRRTSELAPSMDELYGAFLPLLPVGGHILDAGCGPGRDALEFKRRGFQLTAFDGSRVLAEHATSLLGEPVRVMDFEDVDWTDEFDAVWACASLLHVPRRNLPRVVSKLARALRDDGHMYVSFKAGEGDEICDGRLFVYYDSEAILQLGVVAGLEPVTCWMTHDDSSGRGTQVWVNAIFKRG